VTPARPQSSSPSHPIPGTTIVNAGQVVVRYPDTVALNGVSLTVQRGEVVALLGPNGAGKTTLLEAIEGYRRPDSGSISVFGHDPHTHRADIAHRWGVMPQSHGLPMGLTVIDAVTLFARLYGSGHDPGRLLEATGLESLARRRWRRLSGGEQQRLSLAIALAGGSELLLLDEPTAAVDQAGRDRILATIEARARAGTGVLITTHRFDDAETVADRVVILHQGTVVGHGTLNELTRADDTITVRVAESGPTPNIDIDRLAEAARAPVNDLGDGRIRFTIEPSPNNVAGITALLAEYDVPFTGLEAGRRSLAETFRTLTNPTDPTGLVDSPPLPESTSSPAPTDSSTIEGPSTTGGSSTE
jgi:ABC-2 type transport system ATP-binding protein